MKKQIRSITLQDGIYQELVDAIVTGRIEPGSKLTVASLAKQFDVSIMPVREALMRMEATAFITIERNRRITVSELTSENLKNILEARLLNERYSAEKASLQRSDESIKRLEEILEDIAHAQRIEDYLKANRYFHNTIYGQACVPVIYEFIKSLEVRMSPYLHILFRERQDWNAPEWRRNHEGMLEGMKRKNPELICKWLEVDLKTAAGLVNNMIENRRA
ncbi:MAG: GntR family transcriptional regulator [Syntrophaceae bacterium]|nr:GntR family transcriptional regulator [Syntrophaceae bacterium]